MEPFRVHILGCGSARPTTKHQPSCQVVEIRRKLFMIDCGEGAQIGLYKHKLNINHLCGIFLSHNHGDHIFGLPGLLSSMSLLGRTADLHLYGESEIKKFVLYILDTYVSDRKYEVVYHEVDTKQYALVYEDRSLTVFSIPLLHSTPCCGFLFREKRSLPHLRSDMMKAFHIPVSQIQNILHGGGWETEDGTLLTHKMLTRPADTSRSYAYCSDTCYHPKMVPWIQGVDLLYHEATYMSTMNVNEKKYFHSTAKQAALIAKEAKVKKLCLGHFSARIKKEEELLQEARTGFPNSVLAYEGLTLEL